MSRFIVQDKYFQKAKAMGYRARSAFKLEEIQEQFHVIQAGDHVLDLGAAPGSFMQIMLGWVGPFGSVAGVDLQDIQDFGDERAQTFVCDVFNQDALTQALSSTSIESFDVITSDMAPKTSGVKDADTYFSAELAREALDVAEHWLKPGGHMVVKIFEGEDFAMTLKGYKNRFKKVHCFKPKACRDSSYETYIVALKFKKLS